MKRFIAIAALVVASIGGTLAVPETADARPRVRAYYGGSYGPPRYYRNYYRGYTPRYYYSRPYYYGRPYYYYNRPYSYGYGYRPGFYYGPGTGIYIGW